MKHKKVLREDLINYFTGKFPKARYLEVGSQRRECFNRIKAFVKHDCEPEPIGTTPHFKGTSNDFFEMLEKLKLESTYDVGFVDGLHKCEQVLRDGQNVSKHLDENGWIVFHDCLPKEYAGQLREMTEENKHRWNGDCWKAVAWLVSKFPNVWTILDSDQGCGIVRGKLPDFEIPSKEELCDMYTWRMFTQDRDTLLRCITWQKFMDEVDK